MRSHFVRFFAIAVLALNFVPQLVAAEPQFNAVGWAIEHGFTPESGVIDAIERGAARASAHDDKFIDEFIYRSLFEEKLIPAARSARPKIASGALRTESNAVAPVSIRFVSPGSGPTTGGTRAFISGMSFQAGATVTFGGVAGTNVSVGSCTSLSVTAPAHAAGAVDVVVQNPDGTSATAVGAFTYMTPTADGAVMSVISVSPPSGPTSGGTAVTIRGSGFTAGTSVRFMSGSNDSLSATSVTFVDSTTLTAVTPMGAGGNAHVFVSSGTSSATGTNVYRYTGANLPPPTISGFTASAVPGTTITINGSGFTGVSNVRFTSTPFSNVVNTSTSFISATFNVVSSTQISVTVPTRAMTGQILVDTVFGAALSCSNFTPQAAAAPTITTVSASGTWSAPSLGSTGLTVSGTNLVAIQQVLINGKAVAYSPSSATQLFVYPDLTDSSGPITVTTTAGTAVSSTSPAIVAPTFCGGGPAPTITSVSSPVTPSGPYVIEGTGLKPLGNVIGVAFAGSERVLFHFQGSDDTATQANLSPVPPEAVSGAVSVITEYGVATSPAPVTVNAVGVPTISSVSAASNLYRKTVTVSGTNLHGVFSVLIGGFRLFQFSQTSTSLSFSVPANAMSGAVTLTARSGSVTGPVFSTSCAPPSGITFTTMVAAPNRNVTISGTNLVGDFSVDAAVYFNGVRSNSVSVGTTTISARVPVGAGSGPITVHTAYGSTTSAANFTVTAMRGDHNADGRSDVTIFHPSTGDAGMWIMNGSNIASGGYVGQASGFTVVGVGDFNADDRNDLLLRDPAGGVGIWLLDGSTIIAGGYVGSAAGLTIEGVGDFNGDGRSDILFRDSGGGTGAWFMNGATITGGGFIGSSAGFTVGGVGDFNGDGKSDVLLRDSAGGVGMWLLNGTTITSGGYVASASGLTLSGTGDFNGDGRSDIVFQDSSSGVGIWFMNSAAITGGGFVGSAGGFSIVNVGNYNNDSTDDLLLRNTGTGDVGMWTLNGTTITGGAFVSTLSTAYGVVK